MIGKQSEAMKTLGFLNRSLASASEKVKSVAYKTLCRPKVEYAAKVWDPLC